MEVIQLWVIIVILGLIFDFTNGSHDCANVVSTVIATKALRPLIAILFAASLNMIGATQISRVAETITKGLVDPKASTDLLIAASLVGAILWNILTILLGLPSSSSYALVGGLIGGTLAQSGSAMIFWQNLIGKVVLPMIFSPIIGFFLAFCLTRILLRFHHINTNQKTFRYLQVASSGFVALAHGFNDAQKSMAIITLGLFSANLIPSLHIPLWVIIACATMMGLGTAIGGWRIIRTVGFSITEIKPIQGFASELSASSLIVTASLFGFPISSTQMIVGSVAGVGRARGRGSVKWLILKKLLTTWVLTIPAAGFISASVIWMAPHIASFFGI
jgi:inorganic phosphate transporter, PiT family